MRLLFVADGRSPIALNWINYFLERGDQVHLVSTFACPQDARLASLHFLPVAFSAARPPSTPGASASARRGIWGASWVGLRTRLRQWLGPFTLPAAARRLQVLVGELQPDLVHAMRIPYEGMLAALAAPSAPLLISIWGNDFTLHAPSTPWMGQATRRALQRASALHSDCQRDLRLAHQWGFPAGRPEIVLPGAGGIQTGLFFPPEAGLRQDSAYSIVNPRGVRAYICNDSFFEAIPLVLKAFPQARFSCPAMAEEAQAIEKVRKLGLEAQVDLLPRLARSQMADLFRRAHVVVSPSTHDGTPNTLLEAMACGSFPIAGDLESLREWITPLHNGLLVDPRDPTALAQAIIQALKDPTLRQKAQDWNVRLIAERADYDRVMPAAADFYSSLVA